MLSRIVKSCVVLIVSVTAIGFLTAMGSQEPQAQSQSEVSDLQLKRVMLSSGGVGYFEYEAQVSGSEELNLAIRRDQIDDVLKSIVIFDDQGGVGTIRLPSDAPLSEVFRDLPFGPEALGSLDQVIRALKGEEIAVTGRDSMTGRIVSVVRETTSNESGQAIQKHRITLMTDEGLRQFMMQDAETIRFTDSQLDAEVKQVLRQVAERSAQDTRTLTIASQGEGSRRLTVGYVVESPLWKSSYRLVLPQGQEESEDETEARLQGWAILENASGQDWKDVELTILSGDPVTFRQNIYSNYYVLRPEVPIEVVSNFVPDMDEGDIGKRQVVRLDGSMGAPQGGQTKGIEGFRARQSREAASMDGIFATTRERAEGEMALPLANFAAPEPDGALTVTDEESQLLFRIKELVSVEDGESLIVPIIDRMVAAEKVAWMPVNFNEPYPLAAVQLTNDSESTLPPGILTVYEVSEVEGGSPAIAFLGDARLSIFPKGEERLTAYALDRKVKIYSSKSDAAETFSSLKIVDGVLEYDSVRSMVTTATIQGPKDEDRVIVFEINRSDGQDLTVPDDVEVTKTESAFRLKTNVSSGDASLIEARVSWTAKEIQSLTRTRLAALRLYAENSDLSGEARAVFKQLASLQQKVQDANQRLQEIQSRREAIFKEQERIRENIESLPENSSIQQRYLRTLSSQEDELESLDGQESEAISARDAAVKARNDFIRTVEL